MKKQKRAVLKVENTLPTATVLKNKLKQETDRQKVLDEFIMQNLKKEIDYGVIPGTSKPTLLKPGAEKILSLFDVRPRFIKDIDTHEMLGVKGSVCYKCELVNRKNNLVVGEGRGVAVPMEKTSWTTNTQVKICEKRAVVDAVLLTFALSSRYTQDVEEMNLNKKVNTVKAEVVKKASLKQVALIKELCEANNVDVEEYKKSLNIKTFKELNEKVASEVLNSLLKMKK